MYPHSTRSVFGGPRRRRLAAVGAAAVLTAVVAGCGRSQAATTATYQLHMSFFSTESNISPVIDPQMFASAPGQAAGTGPQMIPHAAGFAAVRQAAPPSTPLYGATGHPLGITLGTWENARGSVRFACAKGQSTVTSSLSGLIAGGLYSVFVVHLTVNGAARFTPLGNAAGTDDSFTADAHGAAHPTDHVTGCLDHQEAVVVIWHSDHVAHGATPGVLGVTWHNSLITVVPT